MQSPVIMLLQQIKKKIAHMAGSPLSHTHHHATISNTPPSFLVPSLPVGIITSNASSLGAFERNISFLLSTPFRGNQIYPCYTTLPQEEKNFSRPRSMVKSDKASASQPPSPPPLPPGTTCQVYTTIRGDGKQRRSGDLETDSDG